MRRSDDIAETDDPDDAPPTAPSLDTSNRPPPGVAAPPPPLHSSWPPVRSWVGSGSVQLSDWINDHLAVARSVAFASVGLLAAYGLSHSPLLFRYRTVSDLPSLWFQKRRTLVGRLIDVSTEPTTTASSSAAERLEGLIVFQIRHLSPLERWLVPRAWFETWMRLQPSCAALGRRPDRNPHQLLRVQLAGVRAAPPTIASQFSGAWLQAWVTTQPVVRVQLLARRVPPTPAGDPTNKSILAQDATPSRLKRAIPGLPELLSSDSPAVWSGSSSPSEAVAVAKIRFRDRPLQVLPTDLAEFLARTGRAAVEEGDDGLFARSDPRDCIADASNSVSILKGDAAYLLRLGRAEYEAARGSHGMWADPDVRRSRPDVLEEVEFQETAPWWKKLWKWLRDRG